MEFPIVVAHKLAHGKADQIGGAALVEPVVGRLGAVAMVGIGDVIAIGEDREAAVRTQADIQRRPHVWQVDAWQPVARPLGLMVGDCIPGRFRGFGGRAGKVEAGGGRRNAVADTHVRLLSLGKRLRPAHVEFLTVGTPRKRAAVAIFNCCDRQPNRIERKLLHALAVGLHQCRNGTLGRALGEVEPQINIQVQRLQAKVGRVLRRKTSGIKHCRRVCAEAGLLRKLRHKISPFWDGK